MYSMSNKLQNMFFLVTDKRNSMGYQNLYFNFNLNIDKVYKLEFKQDLIKIISNFKIETDISDNDNVTYFKLTLTEDEIQEMIALFKQTSEFKFDFTDGKVKKQLNRLNKIISLGFVINKVINVFSIRKKNIIQPSKDKTSNEYRKFKRIFHGKFKSLKEGCKNGSTK